MKLVNVCVMGAALAVGAAGGCLAVAAGAAAGIGVYAYSNGELVDTENVSLDRAYVATQTAMKALEFRITDQAKDALNARVNADTSDKTGVRVKLTNKGDTATEFRVRVGVFGDEAKSRLIMDQIKKSL